MEGSNKSQKMMLGLLVVSNIIFFAPLFFLHKYRHHPFIKFRSTELACILAWLIILQINFQLLRAYSITLVPCFVSQWIIAVSMPLSVLLVLARLVRLAFMYHVNNAKFRIAQNLASNEASTAKYTKQDNNVSTSTDSFISPNKLESSEHFDYVETPLTQIAFRENWYVRNSRHVTIGKVLTYIGIMTLLNFILHVASFIIENPYTIYPFAFDQCSYLWQIRVNIAFEAVYLLSLIPIQYYIVKDAKDAYGIRKEQYIILFDIALIFTASLVLQLISPEARAKVSSPFPYVTIIIYVACMVWYVYMIIIPVTMVIRHEALQKKKGKKNIDFFVKKVLQDSFIFMDFKHFTVKSFTVEYPLFYERCQQLKAKFQAVEQQKLIVHPQSKPNDTKPEGNNLPQAIQRDVESIYSVFIKVGSPFELNITTAVKDRIKSSILKKEHPKTIFDEAEKEVIELMFLNSFSHYQKGNDSIHSKSNTMGSLK